MCKAIVWFVLIIGLTTGCQAGSSALDQAATMIAETITAAPPTTTSPATSTPLPTHTPTPKLTSTPYTALTATREALDVLSELDVHVGENSDIPYGEGYLAWQQTEPVTINMSGPQKDAGIQQAIGKDLNATNFIFKSKVTWNASGILICGITFRAESDLNKGRQHQFYFYRLSGLPAYKIDVYQFGRFKNTVSDVKFSEGIDSQNNAANEFVLVAQNEQFIVYINGKQQGQFYEANKEPDQGTLAFLAWQDSGKGSCAFENSWIWVLK